jgi:hypothetical protein
MSTLSNYFQSILNPPTDSPKLEQTKSQAPEAPNTMSELIKMYATAGTIEFDNSPIITPNNNNLIRILST